MKHVGRDCYTLSTGSVRLVALDSASGTLGGLQRAWLEGVLSNATEPVRIVWTHYEFFNPGLTELQQYTDTEEMAYLMRLFETYEVDVVLTGHSHKFDDRTVNGVRYITADDFVDGGRGSSKTVLRLNVTGGNIDCGTFTLQR
jgi:predicted phosphodiesterase